MKLPKTKSKGVAFLAPTVAIVVFTLLDIFYRSGSIARRMATASSDDNPLVYSLVRADPISFKYDFYGRIIADTQDNSIVSKITSWALRNEVMDPKQIWALLVGCQRLFLYIAVYLFIKRITKTTSQTILVLTIFSSTSVYYWNLGWFGALDDQPYPMWMALPFMIFGLTYYNEKSQKKLIVSIIATVLIHPSFGILFAGWIIFDKIMHRDATHYKKYLTTLTLVGGYILSCKLMVPPQARMPESVRKIALTNPHLNFFDLFDTNYKASSLRIWVLIIVVCMLAITYENEFFGIPSNSSIKSIASYSVLLLLIQKFGLLTHQFLIISLCPARFTSVLITLTYLIVISHLVRNLFRLNLFARIAGLIFILFPSPFIVLSYGLKEVLKRNKFSRLSFIFDIFIIFNISILVLPTMLGYFGVTAADSIYNLPFYSSYLNPLNTGFMNFIVPALFSNKHIQILIILSFVLVAVFPLIGEYENHFRDGKHVGHKLNQNAKYSHLVLVLVFVMASKTGMQYQTQWSFNGVNVSVVDSYSEAQIWARDFTKKDSVFFIDGAMPPYYTWRTLSQRPVSNPNPIWSLYDYPKYADEHNLKREIFWDSNVKNGSLDYYGQWNEKYFCLSKQLMNISYVVQNRKQKSLEFPISYANKDFIIYKVSCK